MPLDPQKAMAAQYDTRYKAYTEDDVILYHLGIGAGAPATDAGELEYTYEKNLKVLPTFAMVPVGEALDWAFKAPGFDYENIDHNAALHGDQDLVIHRPLPTAAELEFDTRIAGVYDKGKGALVVIESTTSEKGAAPLYTTRSGMYLRGSGGFGGEKGPPATHQAPDRDPDHVVESPTMPQQALLYRMTGEKNELHVDPEFAKVGGFDSPILQGLCTYGIACKAAVDHALGGDVTRVARYQARFAGIVFPGETIVTSLWDEGDRIVLVATTKERGAPVLSHSAITVR